VVKCDTSRKLDWILMADCMASSVNSSNSNGFFSCQDTWRSILCSSSQDYQRSHGKTSSISDMFESMSCGALTSALKWMEAALNS
jgi:hypothetical protein